MPRALPHQDTRTFLTYTGMETDLMFTQGMDLPGFASFPLLKTSEGRALLTRYAMDLSAVATQFNLGVVLESATWVANADRGAQLGYDADALSQINRDAIVLLSDFRRNWGGPATLISANIGPRQDAYAPGSQVSPNEAEHYHSAQIAALIGTDADLLTAYTLADPNEAIGIARAAHRYEMPCVIAFTVETDGRLPTGDTLGNAIAEVDAATNAYPAYYMINCAHPDHFATTLSNAPWTQRLGGIVANASRCSHAELDAAAELDAGNPAELGRQLANLRQAHPQIKVLGGCCGTDMRHLAEIAKHLAL